MDQTSWIVSEDEAFEQLELFPEPNVVIDYKDSLYDFSKGELRYSFLIQQYIGIIFTTDRWGDDYCNVSKIRGSGPPLWRDCCLQIEEPLPSKPKKNIQPGPRPSLNAKKRW